VFLTLIGSVDQGDQRLVGRHDVRGQHVPDAGTQVEGIVRDLWWDEEGVPSIEGQRGTVGDLGDAG
jgi:hypothetical protein